MAAPTAATLVERLRGLHLRMVDAVLAGDGLERVAELAAEAVGGSVAIVVPRLGAAVMAPAGTPAAERLPELRRYVADLVAGPPGARAARPGGRDPDRLRRRVGRRRAACSRARRRADRRGGGVPAPRGGRVADRGRRRGGARRGRAEPARLVPRGPARRQRRCRPTSSCAAARGWAATSAAARSRSAPSCTPTARATSSRRSPRTCRARWPSTWRRSPAARRAGASTRCCRRSPVDDAGRGDARRGRAAGRAAAAPRHRRAVVVLRRPGRARRAPCRRPSSCSTS